MNSSNASFKNTSILSLGALGVVYGDIGTSPLYALREVFSGVSHAVPLNPANLFGVLSLIFWSLIMVVSIKYVVFVMRASNRGEGGIMALIALLQRSLGENHVYLKWLTFLAILGAAFFYGDSVITPAISVLSAVEGMELIAPELKDWVVPLTLVVVSVLFAFQKYGTASIGRLFGPVMLVWFTVLGVLGFSNIVQEPSVLQALSPHYALQFFLIAPGIAFFSLGAVVLAVTGAEALYADMGHFGSRPIRLAWSGVVLPALILSYFGQGALLLQQPEAIQNPFYLQAPAWALLPLVLLATVATVVASQAVISGAFSLTRQAIQLAFLPRMLVRHTSSQEQGQIYLPVVNWVLFVVVVALILGFGSSNALAAAYGIAVVGTMTITSVLVYFVSRYLWQWGLVRSWVMLSVFLMVDLLFLGANSIKIADGGWLPLLMAVGVFTVMVTWKQGREYLQERRTLNHQPLHAFVRNLTSKDDLVRVPGTAVFMTPSSNKVPYSLSLSMQHYACVHSRLVILYVRFSNEPYVLMGKRVTVERLAKGVYRVRVLFGFMDTPQLPETLRANIQKDWAQGDSNTTYVLGRETLLPTGDAPLAQWRKQLFVAMSRNNGSLASYFDLPPEQVLEMGVQVKF